MSFEGKQIVVTGAGTGIGAAVAKIFLERGADVTAVQNNAPAPHATRRVRMNLSDAASIATAAEQMPASIDVLCNIAGLGADGNSPEDIIGVNYIGTRMFTERLLARIPTTGCVVNTASAAARYWRRDIELGRRLLAMRTFEEVAPFWHSLSLPHQQSYSLSKQAVVLWTLQLANEHGKTGPRFNVLSPGFTDTPMLKRAFSSQNRSVAALPLDHTRIAAPDEIAEVAVFLCSDAARVVNGADLAADAALMAAMYRRDYQF